MKSLVALVAALIAGSSGGFAQQPAAQPAGQPAARGRGGPPALNAAQNAAMATLAVDPALTQAVTAAQAALQEATFALPRDNANITAKAQALATAELNLATARAEGFAKVQGLLTKISPDQAVVAAARGGGGGRGAPPAPDTTDGFVSLFDGKTLTGWDGDPMFWSVKEGALHAESTPEKVVGQAIPGNTFLIWKGGTVKDFELKVDYRFIASGTSGTNVAPGPGNSGIQFRARMSGPSGGRERPWGISGYQFDMVAAGGTGSGVFYTEGGGFGLTPQGTVMRASDSPTGAAMKLIGSMGTGVADSIKASPEWNTYHVIAHGPVMIGLLNGRVTNILVDDNRTGPQYAQEGLLALQMHAGAPFAIEFRNVYLKEIKPENLTKLAAPAGQGRGARGGQ